METSSEKTGLTLPIVTSVLKLSKLQIRAIFTGVLGKPQPADTEPLAERDLFFLFIGDMLERMAGLQPEQRQLIMAELYASDIFSFKGLRQLIIVDGKYCTWSGQTGFMSLEVGEVIAPLPDPPMETIGYNLNELYRRGMAMAEKRKTHVEKNTAGSVEKPRDVRVRAADHAD